MRSSSPPVAQVSRPVFLAHRSGDLGHQTRSQDVTRHPLLRGGVSDYHRWDVATADPRMNPMSETMPPADDAAPPAPGTPPAPAPSRVPWTLLLGLLAGIGLPFLVLVLLGSPNRVASDEKK